MLEYLKIIRKKMSNCADAFVEGDERLALVILGITIQFLTDKIEELEEK